jgi:hypothetical protein
VRERKAFVDDLQVGCPDHLSWGKFVHFVRRLDGVQYGVLENLNESPVSQTRILEAMEHRRSLALDQTNQTCVHPEEPGANFDSRYFAENLPYGV